MAVLAVARRCQLTGFARGSGQYLSAMTPLDVADWRRRTFALYDRGARDRRTPPRRTPSGATERDDLFAAPPGIRPAPEDRARVHRPPGRAVRPGLALRARAAAGASPARSTTRPAPMAWCPFERIGARARARTSASLDVWRLTSIRRRHLRADQGRADGQARRHLRRRPLPARHDQGRGPRLATPAPNTLVLDFNFAYNPSCAYDPAWACPLAPAGNTRAPSRSRSASCYFGNY